MTDEERLKRVEDGLKRLIRIVDGEGDLAPGVVSILRRHEDQISGNTRSLDRMRWSVTGAASVGGALGGAIVFLLTRLSENVIP